MFTTKCKHCGADFHPANPKDQCCSLRCRIRASKIASFSNEKPATYDYIPHHCTMAMLLLQESGRTW